MLLKDLRLIHGKLFLFYTRIIFRILLFIIQYFIYTRKMFRNISKPFTKYIFTKRLTHIEFLRKFTKFPQIIPLFEHIQTEKFFF